MHFQTKVLSIPKDCCEKGTPCARRRALRGDMRGCYGRLPKKLAEGGEPPLSSAFLGAQADFCPGRAYRMASSQACVLLIASRHLDTGSSLSGFFSASQRRQTASQASVLNWRAAAALDMPR